MPKKKSLAEELAELYNPAPTKEYDPDAPEIGDGSRAAGQDDDDAHVEPARPPSKRAPEKARLRGDLDLDDDEAYRGRKTTRAAIFGNNQQGALDSGSDDDGGEDESGDGEGAEDDDDDDVDGQVDDDLDLESGDSDLDDGDDDDDDEVAAAGGSSRARGRRTANGHAGPSNHDFDDQESEGDDGDDLLPSGGDSNLDEGEGTSGEDDDSDVDGDDDQDGAAAAAAAKRRQRGANGGPGRGGGGVDDELAAMEAEYAAVQQEEQVQLQTLRQRTEKERVQGVAVRHQQALYERALEARILLQKCLQASHALPRPAGFDRACSANLELRKKYAALAKEGRATLLQLLDLQHTLMGRHPEIGPVQDGAEAGPGAAAAGAAGEAATPGSHKRGRDAPASANGLTQGGAKRRRGGGDELGDHEDDEDDEEQGVGGGVCDLDVDGLWRRLSAAHTALAPFRDASLDRWHTRTVLSSGSGALRNSLRALNQSISSQVAALLKDPAKFIKRSRLTLSALPKVLCEGRAPGGAGHGQDDDGGTQAPASTEAADVLDEERDDETYDDCEFYQQLLKEFIDKGSGAAAASGLPKASKKRKVVDRRASKGRKLRYHVQDKLVAFMAPVDVVPPPFAANLFSNLFGN